MSEYTGTVNLEVMAGAVNYNRFLVSLVERETRRGDSVVDFGAGIGTFAKIISESGYRVHCVEPDASQLQTLKSSGLSASASIDDIADESVDLLYTFNVLEHIEDDAAVLAQFFGKIRAGGRLLVYVPAFQILFSSMDAKVGHVRRYTRGELGAKATAAGFKIERNEYVDCAGFAASLVYKVLGNDSGEINEKALVAYDRAVFPISRLADKMLKHVIGKNVYLVAVK